MKSKTRLDCEEAIELFLPLIRGAHLSIKSPQMLYCGVAGNPLTHNGKPGLDHPHLFKDYNLTTLDFDVKWLPDVVGDITKPRDWWNGRPYDLVVITQVIEHIPNLWDVSAGLRTVVKNDGLIIVDGPWGPKSPDYHGEPPSFGDYWRISKDGMRALFSEDFNIVQISATDANTSCLLQAK